METAKFEVAIDRDSQVPLYQQIHDGFREQIVNGRLRPGEFFPSEKQLSDELGVNHLTLRKAFQMLTEHHLVNRKKRSGTYVEDSSKWSKSEDILNLGFVIWDYGDDRDYYMEYSNRILSHASKYKIQLSTIHMTPELSLSQHVYDKGIQAVVSAPTIYEKNLSILEQLTVPKVIFEIRDRIRGMDSIVVDPIPGIRQSMNELIRLGHRKIAFVGPLESDKEKPGKFRLSGETIEKYKAYRAGLECHGIDYRPEWYKEIWFDVESSERLIRSFVNCGDMPTAIVTGDDNIARRIVAALKSHGLSIPKDVSVIGFGNILPESKEGWLATVVIDYDRIIEAAMQRISERMKNGGISEIFIPITAHFKSGNSISAPGK